ncbi:unnamed protein product [Bursaphelenchus okinawaensis]|uniref:Uncharacterized protein n=1 Tax=Bursaphelenchus okinawaensis TaxID=465554 RepID=A0A811LM18_9BILA|nr:unnamed protein product [Bursaphelenchus okinawaensis]CAG9127876.1 unnamed protein product [Bursaphelenchus okinawaensis]
MEKRLGELTVRTWSKFESIMLKNGIVRKDVPTRGTASERRLRQVRYTFNFHDKCDCVLRKLKMKKQKKKKEKQQLNSLNNLFIENRTPTSKMTPYNFYKALGFTIFEQKFFPLSANEFYTTYKVEINNEDESNIETDKKRKSKNPKNSSQ